ncbi:hypothetical protein [Cohnella rhizosphaerae]|uniref:Uncharacterized protein n=1 Tax=Cohnella rhizosphaerae TaxID=1457232 RepID=A0A9X4L084_9BACL|nr:hypothetical protein [Cohnella rhizosphaerae]MDG0813818.1 hypothetical protein [Cohnella rhizosphaerae]
MAKRMTSLSDFRSLRMMRFLHGLGTSLFFGNISFLEISLLETLSFVRNAPVRLRDPSARCPQLSHATSKQ